MSTKETKDVLEAGEALVQHRCEVCGAQGETVLAPERPPPNRFCLRCVVEYGNAPGDYDDY